MEHFLPEVQVQCLLLKLFVPNPSPLRLWTLPVFWDLWHFPAPPVMDDLPLFGPLPNSNGGTWLIELQLLTLPCLASIQDGPMALRTSPRTVHQAQTQKRGMPQQLVYISIIISWIHFPPIHTLSLIKLFLTFSLFLLLPYKQISPTTWCCPFESFDRILLMSISLKNVWLRPKILYINKCTCRLSYPPTSHLLITKCLITMNLEPEL